MPKKRSSKLDNVLKQYKKEEEAFKNKMKQILKEEIKRTTLGIGSEKNKTEIEKRRMDYMQKQIAELNNLVFKLQTKKKKDKQ